MHSVSPGCVSVFSVNTGDPGDNFQSQKRSQKDWSMRQSSEYTEDSYAEVVSP